MIKKKPYTNKIELDLTGPQGNAFVILGVAQNLSKQLELDGEAIMNEMQSGDYENLVDVFEKHFGNYVILYR